MVFFYLQYAEEEAHRLLVLSQPVDFLAPYLVIYHKAKLTPYESRVAYNACLSDMRTRFVHLLNQLQRQYENVISNFDHLYSKLSF